MKQLFIFLFFICSISSYSQTIEGFLDFKFGTEKGIILADSSIKDSIESERGSPKDLHILVRNVKFDNDTYDGCWFMFYKDELYGGVLGKLFDSEKTLLQAVDSIKSTIQIEADGSSYKESNMIEKLIFEDSQKNALVLEAFKRNDFYALNLSYYSARIIAKKEKDKKQEDGESWSKGFISVEVDDKNR